jgi:hypothetical protein
VRLWCLPRFDRPWSWLLGGGANRGRPHSSLGPGVPDPPALLATVRKLKSRHRLGKGVVVLAKSVLDGLHHEYSTGAECRLIEVRGYQFNLTRRE